ncbi:hypothetical protein Tco_1328081 [Tanacetum coccineum]
MPPIPMSVHLAAVFEREALEEAHWEALETSLMYLVAKDLLKRMGTPTKVCVRSCPNISALAGRPFRLLVDVIEDSHKRLVENIDECNVFPWGEYIWRHLYDQLLNVVSKHKWEHLKGLNRSNNYILSYELSRFVWDFKIWILESCEQSILWWNKEPNVIPRALAWSRKEIFNRYEFVKELKVNTDLTTTISELKSDWCDSSFLIKEIRLKDNVITQLNTRVFKPEAIIQVLGRERNAGYRDNLDFRQYFVTLSEDLYAKLKMEFIELTRSPLFGICPLMQDQNSDDDVIKKMMEEVFLKRLKEEVMLRVEKEKLVNYEREKNKRRHALMNSDHWEASTSRIINSKRSQRSSDFSAYYWGAALGPRATNRVHLTDDFDIYLGQRGPLRNRFPWCKDVCVDRSLSLLTAHELWVNYMWHVRPVEADWAMVDAYFDQILLQDSIPVWYADGSRYKIAWKDVDHVMLILNVSLPFLISFMCMVNEDFQFTPLNSNLQLSCLSPIGASEGLWCFSYGSNMITVLWNPSIIKSIGVFIPYFVSQLGVKRLSFGFGVRLHTLDPTLLKISYLYGGHGPWFMNVYTVSTSSWYPVKNHRLPRETVRIRKRSGQAVLGRFIYWVGYEKILGTFCVGDIVLLCGWDLVVDGASVTSFSMLFSIPTINSVKLISFSNNDAPIVEVDELGYQLDHTLQVYDPISERVSGRLYGR